MTKKLSTLLCITLIASTLHAADHKTNLDFLRESDIAVRHRKISNAAFLCLVSIFIATTPPCDIRCKVWSCDHDDKDKPLTATERDTAIEKPLTIPESSRALTVMAPPQCSLRDTAETETICPVLSTRYSVPKTSLPTLTPRGPKHSNTTYRNHTQYNRQYHPHHRIHQPRGKR